MRTAKTLIRLGGCPGWSESSLGAHSFCWFCHVAAHMFLVHLFVYLVCVTFCVFSLPLGMRLRNCGSIWTSHSTFCYESSGKEVNFNIHVKVEIKDHLLTRGYLMYLYIIEKIWSHHNMWAATWQNQQSDCAPSEDSDQPGHPPSLIRVFAVRMKKAWVLSYPLSAQRRLWSDWADAQADLSLR